MTNIDGRISTVLAARLVVMAPNGQPSQRIADDELLRRRELLHSCIAEHGGREFSGSGGDIYAEFPATSNAIVCAEMVIASVRQLDTSGHDDKTGVGIGISLGDVREDGQTLYGDAVETASALRALAGVNEIVVAGAVREQARERTDLVFRRLRPPPGQTLWVSAYAVSGKDVAQTGYAFIQELIRRRVFRAAGAYIIASWILVQVASIVFPEFDVPNWSMRALIIILTVGFPLLVLLAWTIDLSAKGLQRTPDSHYSRTKGNALRFGVVAVAAAMSAGVLWWVWTDYIEPGKQRPTRAAIKSNPVVAIDTPRKMAGADDIDWLGEGVANLLRDELAESSEVVVLSQSRWSEIASKTESHEELHSAARKMGIDYLVEGNYQQLPGGLVFNARVEDVENDTQIQGIRLERSDAAGVISATSEIAMSIKRALKIPLTENVSRFAADFAVQNMDAYEAYIAGLAYLINFDYQLAEQSFDAALSLVPDYHMARYRLAMVMQSTGRSALALRELNAIPNDADLTEREHLYVEGAKAHFTAEQDPVRSIEIYKQLVELYPYDMESRQHLGNAYWLNYQENEALAEFRKLAELHSYDPSAWMALGERLLDVGELDEAEQALKKYLDMSPQDHFAVALLGNLAQLRGEYADSIDFYNRSLTLKPGFAVATLGLARSHYMNGASDTAESLWSQLISDADQVAVYRIDAAFDLAGILRGQGRFDESFAPLNTVEDIVRLEGPRTAMMLSTLGLTALEIGDHARAAALIDEAIAESPRVATRYLFARGILELELNRLDQLQNTAAEIRALALPPDDSDRTEDKAVSYLLGMSAFRQDDHATAGTELVSAVSENGYEYAVYAIGLARLHLATGNLDDAAALADGAMSARDPGDLRLDLELDRARAMLLHAEILARMGSVAEAREQSRRFVERWQSANAFSPDLLRARQLLSAE
jgi:tetratricopeptide (TPR) repeat protein